MNVISLHKKKWIFSFCIAVSMFVAPHFSEAAKSVTVTVNGIPRLAHDWVGTGSVHTDDDVPLDTTAWGAKWLWGLDEGAAASILYRARLIDNDSGLEIADGASVPVGTNIRIDRVPAQDSDIFWNGTGKAFDTPYGFWVADAGPLPRACHDEDQTYYELVTIDGVEAPIIAYTLLDVAPVTEQVVMPSANLSCTGNVCQVVAPGPISLGMDFSQTHGMFYYRYLDHPQHYGGGCRANNAPMRVIVACNYPDWWPVEEYCYSHGFTVEATPYDLQFPQANITFDLTATPAGNTSPLSPVVSPQPFSGEINTVYSWTVQSTDPDGDDLYYQFDWNNDGLPDQNSGALVTSGTLQTLTNPSTLWDAEGVYVFQVRAVDANMTTSPWTTASVSVTAPVVPVECPAGQVISWMVGTESCSDTTSVMSAGGSLTLSDSVGPATGMASFSCRADGTWDTAQTFATCSIPAVPPDPISIDIELNPTLVRYGQVSNVTINISSPEDAICTVYGMTNSSFPISHSGASGVTVYTGITKRIMATQTVSVYCVPSGSGATPNQKQGVIRVIPWLQEV